MARQGPGLLTQWRRGSKLTQQDAAKALGVSQSTLSELENGKLVPKVDTAGRIERVTAGAVPVTSWIDATEDDKLAETG